MPPAAPASARRPSWLAPVLLVAAVVLAYANSLHAPFLFDDAGAVVDNPTIRRLGSVDVLRPPADGSTTTGRPLANLSFALNYALSGELVWSYHAGNVVIHAAAALLLLGLVRRVLSGPVLGQRFGSSASWMGFFSALLWALHPLQTESVVCIAQRTETLCGFFYLLTIYAFVRAIPRHPLDDKHVRLPRATDPVCHPMDDKRIRPGRWFWFTVSFAACFFGMATKEVMVTAPVLVFLFDRTFVAGTFAAAWRARRSYHGAMAITWLLLAFLVLQGGGARGVAAGFELGVSPWSYLLKQCEALVLYVRLALWPHPLVLDYGRAVVQSAAEVWWQALLVLTLLAGTAWALVRRPALGFLGAWFFLILAPSSSVVPLVTQTMAEHRMYLPLGALVVGAVVVLGTRWPMTAKFALPSAAVVLALTTNARNRDYGDPLTIWTTTVDDYPRSARAHQNLALVLYHRGRSAEADRHFARAVELDPNYVTAFSNWGVALLGERRFDEAIRCFERALQLAPREGAPAAKLGPQLADAHVELGRLLERERRGADAETHYLAALQLVPGHASAHARLGLLYARSDRLDDAARELREAARLSPDDADVRANLGNVLLLQGRPRDALVQFEAALRLRPDDARLRESIRTATDALR